MSNLIEKIAVNLGAGASGNFPHTLGVVPDLVIPSANLEVTAITSTQVSVTNLDLASPVTGEVLLVAYHSIQRVVDPSYVPGFLASGGLSDSTLRASMHIPDGTGGIVVGPGATVTLPFRLATGSNSFLIETVTTGQFEAQKDTFLTVSASMSFTASVSAITTVSILRNGLVVDVDLEGGGTSQQSAFRNFPTGGGAGGVLPMQFSLQVEDGDTLEFGISHNDAGPVTFTTVGSHAHMRSLQLGIVV